jgi:hypothetical protein
MKKLNREGFLSEDLVDRIEEQGIDTITLNEMDLDELCYRMKTKRPVAQIIKKYASYIPSVK